MKPNKMENPTAKRPKCNYCELTFKRRYNLKIHVTSVHQRMRFKCDKCDYEASKKVRINQHNLSMHEGKFVKCDRCDRQFPILGGKRNLARHKSVDHENIRHKCPNCNKTFAFALSLRTHVVAEHEGNPKNQVYFLRKRLFAAGFP